MLRRGVWFVWSILSVITTKRCGEKKNDFRIVGRNGKIYPFFLSRATDLSDGTAAALCVRTSSPVACWHCLNETEEAVGWSKVEMGKEEGSKTNGIVNI